MAKRIITVFGATGKQGGSVVKKFLEDPKLQPEWSIRGVTRDVSSASAKALTAKGVEMVTVSQPEHNSPKPPLTPPRPTSTTRHPSSRPSAAPRPPSP
jgi:nucleoside-diphosphate-sugar epimerase